MKRIPARDKCGRGLGREAGRQVLSVGSSLRTCRAAQCERVMGHIPNGFVGVIGAQMASNLYRRLMRSIVVTPGVNSIRVGSRRL
jgi:hypothetical protein